MLAFRSLQDGPPRLFTHVAHDPDAADTIVPMSSSDETPTDWRSGRIVAHGPGAQGDLDLFTVSVESGARETIANTGFNESDGRLSPDGRWLAYVSDEAGQADVYTAPFPRGPRVRVSFAGGSRPRWGRDGRSLFFLRGNDIMRADMSGTRFVTPRVVATVAGLRDYDVSWRRDTLLALLPVGASRATVPSVIVDWRSLMN
jgi:Tol biopolymer transport system component